MKNTTIILLILVLLLSACSAEASIEGKVIDSPETNSQTTDIACPRGIHDDPAPGRCYLYTDGDKNGFCDYR